MRILLAAVLILCAVPLLALGVLPEVPVSPAELAPTPFTRHQQIASNGDTYVAVWTDYRISPRATYAARLRADGTLLDRVGILVAPNSQAGAVIWSGSAFLIAYLQEGMVTVRALSPDGVLGDPIEVFGNYVLPEVYRMRMATNGDSVLLVTSDATAAILGPEGHERRQISFPWLFAQRGLGVAAAGSTYLVAVGTHDGFLKTQIVTAEGDFGATQVLMSNVEWYGAEVASDGDRFLVAWARGNLYAQFVTREGVPVETPLALTALEPVYFYSHTVTRLVRRGDEYLLVYRTWGGAPFDTMRLGNAGEKRGPLLTGFEGEVVDIVTDDGRGAVLGSDDTSVLSAAFFDGGSPAELRNRTPVAISGKQQAQVRLARMDDGFAAAWVVEQRDAAVMLSRGPASNPVVVAAGRARLIDVVFESSAIWVLWIDEEEDDVYVRRFTSRLEAIDPQPVLFAESTNWAGDVSAAAGGGVVVVVHNGRPGPFGLEPEGPHIGAHILRGIPIGIDTTEVGVASVDGFDRLPAVAWTGNAFLVAWANATDYYPPLRTIRVDDVGSPYKPDDRILAVRMTPTGELLDADPLEVTRSKSLHALSVAGTALAWQTYETPNFSSRRHTYAARAVANAPVADLGGEDTYFGAFASDDGGFLLTRARQLDSTTLQPEILRIDASLAVTETVQLQPMTVNFIYFPPNPFDVDLIGGPLRTIGYSRIAGDDYGQTRRIFLRRLAEVQRRRALR